MTAPATAAAARKLIESGWATSPRTEPCTCGAPRKDHHGQHGTGACPRTGCRRYRRDPADALAERAVNAASTHILDDLNAWHANAYPRPKVKKDGWGVGPSDLSQCRRAIQYRERPPEDLVLAPEDKTAALLGNLWHDVIVTARRALYPWREFEFPIEIPGFDRRGRMDEYDPLTAIGVDYKTKSRFTWETLGLWGPPEHDWKQLAVYCYGLWLTGRPVETMRLIYVNRETGEDEQYNQPFNLDFARDAVGELHAILMALDTGQDLPRDGRGINVDPRCGGCRFRLTCWNVAAAQAAGRSPESYTILGADPDHEIIEWAAGRIRETADAKTEAEREYKAVKPLLRGVPDGVYGLYKVKERSRDMPDYKGFYQAVQDVIDAWANGRLVGDLYGHLARIQVPRRRDVWTEVKHAERHHATTEDP